VIDFAMCVCYAERVLVRAFAGDEARPLGPVLGECSPLGVAEWYPNPNPRTLQKQAERSPYAHI